MKLIWNIHSRHYISVLYGAMFLCFNIIHYHHTYAQDVHFSQLDVNPMLFNPAYSGFFEDVGRFGAVYRNQWASVSAPFQTFSATAEWGIWRHRGKGISGGLWINNDRAGSLAYGSTSISAITSYFQSITSNDVVSIAIEGGVGQIGFNSENIVVADDGESFSRTKAIVPTIGAGIAWFREYSDVFYTKIGASVRNINEPNISYTELNDSRLARKWNIYTRAEWRAWSQVGLLPVVGYQYQNAFNELVYGCDVRWYVREKNDDYLAFSAGLLGRHGDAASINLAVELTSWTFAFSYDINLSQLAAASHTIGAFELGVVYMLRRKNSKKRALPCPII